MQAGRAREATTRNLLLVFGLMTGVVVGSFIPFITDHLQPRQWIWIILATLSSFPLILFIQVIRNQVVRKKITYASLLWILVMLGTSLSFRQRDPRLLATSEAVDAQVLFQLALYAVCGLFVLSQVAPWRKRFLKTLFTSPLKWMFFYGVVALISTIYSTFWTLTLVSSLQLITVLSLLSIAIAIIKVPAKQVLDITLAALLVVEMTVWILYFIDPTLAITIFWPNTRRLGGLLIHPNGLAAAAAVLSVVALCRWLVGRMWLRRLKYLALFLVSVITLIAAKGRASLVACLLASLSVMILLRQKYLLLLSIIVVLSIVLFSPAIIGSGIEKFERGEDITKLTGRVAVWRFVISQAGQSRQSLFLGNGYGTSRVSLLEQLPGRWTHTHNAFLEGLMGLGIFGMMFLTMSFASVGFFLLRRLLGTRGKNYVFYVELVGVIVIVFVVSMTSAAVGGRLGISSFIYLAVLACCVRTKLPGEI